VDNESSNRPIESRPPSTEDLVTLCKSLNEKKVKYIIVGGMAMINAGLTRATGDIDLLIESSVENFEKVKNALMYLPDKAVKELAPDDIDNYTVIKVADEIVIDLMKSACGVSYDEGQRHIIKIKLQDVEIPFADIELLYKTKQTLREKDKIDRMFLEEIIRKRNLK